MLFDGDFSHQLMVESDPCLGTAERREQTVIISFTPSRPVTRTVERDTGDDSESDIRSIDEGSLIGRLIYSTISGNETVRAVLPDFQLIPCHAGKGDGLEGGPFPDEPGSFHLSGDGTIQKNNIRIQKSGYCLNFFHHSPGIPKRTFMGADDSSQFFLIHQTTWVRDHPWDRP